ncbi:MAG: hypothetical protein LKJ47_04865 [Bifidobacteriaceae bacterium]|nr:hypothetical protein [Bifidobacteriaceae bacterium]
MTQRTSVCEHCHKEFNDEFTTCPHVYCSERCRSQSKYRRQKRHDGYAKTGMCERCGNERKIVARQLCNSCYRQWHRTTHETHYECECKVCGSRFTSRHPDATVCSHKCASDLAFQSEGWQQHQARVQATKKQHKPPLTKEQKHKRWLSTLSPLRRAWLQHDTAAFFKELKANSIIDEAGCWNWNYLNNSGYPVATLDKKKAPLHRASLEMRYGKPLGTQQAHHMCGNSHCVNPNHLQPATAAANIGEMLARKSYENRIKELEQYIRNKEPNAEILNRIKYGD